MDELESEAGFEVSGSVESETVNVRSVTVYDYPDADYSLPMKSAIKEKQLKLMELVEGQTSWRTMFGPVTPHEEELLRAALTGAVQAVLSLPVGVRDLQVRLMVCMYTDNENRGKSATLQVLRGYRVWQDMENDVSTLKFLHCQVFKAGKMVQRPLGEVLLGGLVNEVGYTSTFSTLVLVDCGIRNVLGSKDINPSW